MSSQYDQIGSKFNDIKQMTHGKVELATLLNAMGNISGKRCLDLACGAGYYSQRFRAWGASYVLGVDISKKMVDDAKEVCKSDPQIEFQQGNCSEPKMYTTQEGHQGDFDFIYAGYLLNYAARSDEMIRMYRTIAMNLKAGGLFVGMVPGVSLSLDEPLHYGGVNVTKTGDVEEGHVCKVVVGMNPPIEFQCYHLWPEVYEQSAAEAGLKFQWGKQIVPDELKGTPEGDNYDGRAYTGVVLATK